MSTKNVSTEKTANVELKKTGRKASISQDETKTPTINRDYTRYSFGGSVLGKRKLVLNVIKDYMEKHPEATAQELETTFGKVVKPIGKTKSMSAITKKIGANSLRNFFVKEDDLIRTADKNYVAVFNQWSKNSLEKFIDHVKEMGYKIKPVNTAKLAQA